MPLNVGTCQERECAILWGHVPGKGVCHFMGARATNSSQNFRKIKIPKSYSKLRHESWMFHNK